MERLRQIAIAASLLSGSLLLAGCMTGGPTRAESLVARLEARIGKGRVVARPLDTLSTDDVDGIVNATPIGMAAHPGLPLPADLIDARHWVVDIIYFPLETELLRIARAKGCPTLNGRGMVIGQAARAFEIITGRSADQARMAESFPAG